jgi:N-acetylmuramoyl-L-alanine amidase
MGKLTHLIIHCTATPAGRKVDADDIWRWHTSPKEMGGRGWDRVGYSDMIYLDGTLVNLTPFNQDNSVDPWEITWGAKGMNSRSRHVVYVGGLDYDYATPLDEDDQPGFMPFDTRTPEQKHALEIYVKYMILRHPDIKVAGHNQFAMKACPSFNVPYWLRQIGIPEKNIHE